MMPSEQPPPESGPDAMRQIAEFATFPETPEIWPSIAPRVLADPILMRSRTRRRLALAAALLLLALGGSLAFWPDLRGAIAERLGIPGIVIEFVPNPPTHVAGPGVALLGLGEPVALAQARAMADFPVNVPSLPGWSEPAVISVVEVAGQPMVSFIYEPTPTLPASEYSGVGALLTQFAGSTEIGMARKGLTDRTNLRRVTVLDAEGFWIDGEAHFFTFENAAGEFAAEPIRLAGNTLIWDAAGVTFRLESQLSLAAALAVAESLPPPAPTPGTD